MHGRVLLQMIAEIASYPRNRCWNTTAICKCPLITVNLRRLYYLSSRSEWGAFRILARSEPAAPLMRFERVPKANLRHGNSDVLMRLMPIGAGTSPLIAGMTFSHTCAISRE